MPEPSAVVVPIDTAAMKTSTVLFASAVPDKVGAAVFTAVPVVGDVISGAAGSMVSTVTVTAGVDATPVLPAASVAVAVKS